jgi:hypothetical protein
MFYICMQSINILVTTGVHKYGAQSTVQETSQSWHSSAYQCDSSLSYSLCRVILKSRVMVGKRWYSEIPEAWAQGRLSDRCPQALRLP